MLKSIVATRLPGDFGSLELIVSEGESIMLRSASLIKESAKVAGLIERYFNSGRTSTADSQKGWGILSDSAC